MNITKRRYRRLIPKQNKSPQYEPFNQLIMLKILNRVVKEIPFTGKLMVAVVTLCTVLLVYGCSNSKMSDSEKIDLSSQSLVQVIPQPQQTGLCDGEFDFSKDVKIICNKELNDVASIFNERLFNAMGLTFPLQTKGVTNGNITLKTTSKMTEKEGYILTVSPSGIQIEAAYSEGVFYGLQTLQQLILNSGNSKIPCCRITDAPRFAWRGVMLDVSRTFMPMNLIKRYIDIFSAYKLNVLHLHLTDDQGWRVEIKQYPRLTQVGAKFGPEFNCMGGYYSQDEIRELVRYASLRNITVIPEIDMPGHVCAAIAAYPELSCDGEIPVIHTFFEGPPRWHEEIFCAGKETTYQFIFNVLDEIMALFPSTYIHIGGDEALKAKWEKCTLCQKMMTDNGLNNEEELQSHFVNRIGAYLRKNGRTLVGWDEIIDGGKLSGNEVLMYWRSQKKEEVEKMATSGFRLVCTPTSHCYFDYPYQSINTHKIYHYEPVIQDAFEEKYLGVQANFWSHIDRSEYNIDKQLFPRILGLAETAWCLPRKKDWEHFKSVAWEHIERLKEIDDVNVYPDASLDDRSNEKKL